MGDILFGEKQGKVITGSALDQNQRALSDALARFFLGNYAGGQSSEVFDPTMRSLVESGLSRLLSGEPVANDEFIRTNVVNPARTALAEQVLPGVREAYAGPGTYWNSARANAEAKAIKDTESDIARNTAMIKYQDSTDALGRVLAALGPALQYGQLLSSTKGQMLNAMLQYLGLPTQYAFYQQPRQGILPSLLNLAGSIYSGGGFPNLFGGSSSGGSGTIVNAVQY